MRLPSATLLFLVVFSLFSMGRILSADPLSVLIGLALSAPVAGLLFWFGAKHSSRAPTVATGIAGGVLTQAAGSTLFKVFPTMTGALLSLFIFGIAAYFIGRWFRLSFAS
ncbi:MAG: hypothetical protein ACI9GW_003485 [Halieaceae bacterium]|jgi:hypothetical protein